MTSSAGRMRTFDGSLPRATRGLGTSSLVGRSSAVSLFPLDFCRSCSLIVLEAENSAVYPRLLLAIRAAVSGIFHAGQSTEVRPQGKALFTRWFAGFVVTYGKDRNAGSCRQRVSPFSKAPGPTALCPVGP